MASHKCNRNDCPADGPKVNCLKCKNKCNLKCFGFEKSATIDGNETVKCLLPNGQVVVMFLSCMGLVCCEDTVSSTEARNGLKWPIAKQREPSRGKATNDSIMSNEIRSIKEMLLSIKNATEQNANEIAAIKTMTTTTEANVKKVTEMGATTNACETPKISSPAWNYVSGYRKRAAEKAAAAGTPQTGKRRRPDSTPNEKQNYPQPKIGTKSNVGGLSVVAKRELKQDDKPKFEKAIWISRLSPSVTEAEIVEFIASNTTVTDKAKMNVRKLVKKDADLSTLNFVSFKVEVNANDFNVLIEPDVWPTNVMVREFMQSAPKITLKDHFPGLNDTDNRQLPPPDQEGMDTAQTTT